MSKSTSVKNSEPSKKQKIDPRKYQEVIARNCTNKNSLIVLPTGLGKTIIAILVAEQSLMSVPSNSKIIVLAPTRPLINQHYESFAKFFTVPEEKFCLLTGKVAPEKRAKLFQEKQLLFFTPQTLRNDLVKKKYDLKGTCLIIFDEAHHASGNYPYTLIADTYMDQNSDGSILALTASPGASKEKISALCQGLHIPPENIHIRNRKDEDVKTYVKPRDVFKIGVQLTDLMKEIYSTIENILEERLQYLSQLNFIEKKSTKLREEMIRKDLLKLNKNLLNVIKGSGDKTGAYSALSVNAQALILYHMLELVEQQGLDVLLIYLHKFFKHAVKKNSSKAHRILATDIRIRQIFQDLKKHQHYSQEALVHPKQLVLKRVVLDELNKSFSHGSTTRILVFVKLRNSVSNIVKGLKENDVIKPVRFVGQATKSKEDKGLSQKEQIEILRKFKEGKYNVLVSTNVGEEGLDIAECDLVVFYDVVANEIRLIQREGRTARHRKGKVIILYSKGTHDETYLRIALGKLKRMNKNLKNSSDLKHYHEPKITRVDTNQEIKIETTLREHEKNQTKRYVNLGNKQQKQKQATLQSFISNERKKKARKNLEAKKKIRINMAFPMRYGLRKWLKEQDILFTVDESKFHIVIFDDVLIQIYDPSEKSFDDLISEFKKFKQEFKVVLAIFDFVYYEEEIKGQKGLVKQEILRSFRSHSEVQVVIMDNVEELFFMINTIYRHHDKEANDKKWRI